MEFGVTECRMSIVFSMNSKGDWTDGRGRCNLWSKRGPERLASIHSTYAGWAEVNICVFMLVSSENNCGIQAFCHALKLRMIAGRKIPMVFGEPVSDSFHASSLHGLRLEQALLLMIFCSDEKKE